MPRSSISVTIDQKKVKQDLAKYILKNYTSKIDLDEITLAFKDSFVRNLYNHPAWFDLLGGRLAADFGLPKGTESQRLRGIADMFRASIFTKNFTSRVSGSNYVFYIYVQGIPQDYGNVFSLPESSVTTDKGEELPWLWWLLTQGDTELIPNFTVAYGNYPDSRSGAAIMVVSPGESFSVDPLFSGVVGQNLLTEVVSQMEQDKGLISRVSGIIRKAYK